MPQKQPQGKQTGELLATIHAQLRTWFVVNVSYYKMVIKSVS